MRYERLVAFGAVYLLWGGSYLAIRSVVSVLPPFLAAGVRYSLAGLALVSFVWIRNTRERPALRPTLNAIGTGVLGLGLSFGAVFWASTRLPSWIVGVLFATTFLWTYIGECLIARRLPNPPTIASILIGLAAIAVIAAPRNAVVFTSTPPLLIALAAAAVWSASLLAAKHISLPADYRCTAALQMSAAGMFLLLLSVTTGEWTHLPSMAGLLTIRVLGCMAYLIFAGSLIAFTAFHWLIAHERLHLVATSSYVNPLVALVLGVAICREAWTGAQMGAAALLLGSIAGIWYLEDGGAPVPDTSPHTIPEVDLLSSQSE